MTEITEVQNSSAGETWNPFVGEEVLTLLKSKGFTTNENILNEDGERVLDETYQIMQLCGNPSNLTNNETGIVIGYVQSGKTLSFTTLTALARDNFYQIIIIIGGVSVNLLEQSTKRVRKDLRIDSRYGFDQKWTQITNPNSQEDHDTITSALDQWADPTYPNDRCKTLLITVMKNGSHLKNLSDLMSDVKLIGVPTLIIDDEGDQASLNTRARWASRRGMDIEGISENEVSTIYRRLTSLRNRFPHHTFLQYTATPQANLFINILDRLSPNFIKLLTPGDDYTGGIHFFRENVNLIREIPISELPNTGQSMIETPNSLMEALRIFYLGVAIGLSSETFNLQGQHNRSMLIHPSRLQGDHTTFYAWVNTIKESWKRLLTSNENNDEKIDLINAFKSSYNDLATTVPDLPQFDTLIENFNLAHAIQYTPIVEVNSRRGATPQINWQDHYSWILVGGQSMDRGFTVEGLTVTYMPRNLGVGNVDTIQQRARFFGYKKNYLGFCRVFLDEVTTDAYTYIVDHEEDVRNRLREFAEDNRNLNEWDREAVLDQMLNLTRTNILFDEINRDKFGNDWFRIHAPHDTEELIEPNRHLVFDFVSSNIQHFTVNDGHIDRTDDQKHLVAELLLKDCLEHLLNKLKYTRERDSAIYSSLRGILKRYIEKNPNEKCLIYLMSANDLTNWKSRIRKLDKNDEIQKLFQGRNPLRGEITYPGDSEMKRENMLTIQIHLLDLRETNFTEVPTLAIWIPENIGKDIIRIS